MKPGLEPEADSKAPAHDLHARNRQNKVDVNVATVRAEVQEGPSRKFIGGRREVISDGE